MRIIRFLFLVLVFTSFILFVVAIAAPLKAKDQCGCAEKLTATHYVNFCLYTDAWLCWWNPNGAGRVPD